MNREQKKIASWKKWSASSYLSDYYSAIQPDELETIKFLVQNLKDFKNKQFTILEFGAGPTLHHIFPAVPYATEIHMSDYLHSNLNEIKKWLRNGRASHSWDKFIEYTLQLEGQKEVSLQHIISRKNATKKKITKLLFGNANKTNPLGNKYRGYYPLVISCYCADSATENKKKWAKYMKNISSLVSDKGTLIIAALRKTRYYKVGDKSFPSANIDENDLRKFFGVDFSEESVKITVRDVHQKKQGYSSIILAKGVKK